MNILKQPDYTIAGHIIMHFHTSATARSDTARTALLKVWVARPPHPPTPGPWS